MASALSVRVKMSVTPLKSASHYGQALYCICFDPPQFKIRIEHADRSYNDVYRCKSHLDALIATRKV